MVFFDFSNRFVLPPGTKRLIGPTSHYCDNLLHQSGAYLPTSFGPTISLSFIPPALSIACFYVLKKDNNMPAAVPIKRQTTPVITSSVMPNW